MTDKLPDNGGYVAAAYLVFLALLLIYLAIMSVRAARLERELSELNHELAQRDAAAAAAVVPEPAGTGAQA